MSQSIICSENEQRLEEETVEVQQETTEQAEENNQADLCYEDFCDHVVGFFWEHFKTINIGEHGELEIRTFENNIGRSKFFDDYSKAADYLWQLKQSKTNSFFGVNPRVGKGGCKKNVQNAVTIHVDVDYGEAGHKKKSDYPDRESAEAAIRNFEMVPTYTVHTGGGFHLYFMLEHCKPVPNEIVVAEIESITKAITKALGGDSAQDISRVLRVPFSDNCKLSIPRPVEIVQASNKRYKYRDLLEFAQSLPEYEKIKPNRKSSSNQTSPSSNTPAPEILTGNPLISDDVRQMINGNCSWFNQDRSVCDMKIVGELVRAGVSRGEIFDIYQTYPTTGKFADHNSPPAYLNATIDKAIDNSDLSESELADPLFANNVLYKKDNKVELSSFDLQEYLVQIKHLKEGQDSGTIYYYDGRQYCPLTNKMLNKICQKLLASYRRLFKQSHITNILHHLEAAEIQADDTADLDLIGFENGIFDTNDMSLQEFSHDRFIRNILPFPYDANAQAPRWHQFLDEVFESNQDVLTLVQEIVGYTFHKEMSKASFFLLHGFGANGKSVFLNLVECLHGKENTSSVSLGKLNDDNQLIDLMGKTINISSESSAGKYFESDRLKQVTAGDLISARAIYKDVVKFKPYAKHFFAVNSMPELKDDTYGMKRRMYIIDFPVTFKKGDPHLTKKLKLELPGIFNWAFEGYQRLLANDFEFSCSEDMLEQMNEQYNEDNETAEFVAATLTKSLNNNDRILWGDYYKYYENHMRKNNISKYLIKKRLKIFITGQGFVIRNSPKDGNDVMIHNAKLKT